MLAVETKIKKRELWTCPTCKRKFAKRGQSHSCKLYSLALHFEHKPAGKVLYQKLKQAVQKNVGSFMEESLECCIHFTSDFTFAAVKILKDKIRLEFSLKRKLRNARITKLTSVSTHRFLYCVDIEKEEDIDTELLGWIKEAYALHL